MAIPGKEPGRMNQNRRLAGFVKKKDTFRTIARNSRPLTNWQKRRTMPLAARPAEAQALVTTATKVLAVTRIKPRSWKNI
jgi:hypothetical protein